MSIKKTFEVRRHAPGFAHLRRDTFKAALKEYEKELETRAAKGETHVVELVCIEETTLLSTSEKLSSERGYASKNG